MQAQNNTAARLDKRKEIIMAEIPGLKRTNIVLVHAVFIADDGA